MNPSSFSHDSAGSLVAFGWNESVSARYQPHDIPGNQPVRIVRVDRAACRVATFSGISDCQNGPQRLAPATGDWAVATTDASGGLVLQTLLPRTSAVGRRNAAASGEQVLVANVDTMFLLHGVDRPHRVGRLERLAIVSWDAGVQPVIVLTKIDLLGTEAAVIGAEEAVAEINKVIHDIVVVPISSLTGVGVARLSPYLGESETVGLLGESGAGKSSLVNLLAGGAMQSTGRTRSGDHKGRHTTSSRDLVPLPGGAVLVDTPGLRSISMLAASDGLARAYADLASFSLDCRFRNCTHQMEPGCGIQAALDAGRLTPKRWAGYQKLQGEMEREARRATTRARRTESRTSGRRRRAANEVDEW